MKIIKNLIELIKKSDTSGKLCVLLDVLMIILNLTLKEWIPASLWFLILFAKIKYKFFGIKCKTRGNIIKEG